MEIRQQHVRRLDFVRRINEDGSIGFLRLEKAVFAAEPAKVKAMLKEEGFPQCGTAITEWHYLVSWEGIQTNMTPEKRKQAIEGPTGIVGIDSAVFNLAVLCAWQDSPLDLAFYYGARPKGGSWGFYNNFGGFNRNFHSMVMFGDFLKNNEKRIRTVKQADTVYLLGGLSADSRQGQLLIADYRGTAETLSVKITGMDKAAVTAERLDQEHDPAPVEVQYRDGILTLPKSGPGSAAFKVTFR